mmetsp:Transcript_18933/g.47822  ORF Transcript_18933/g.47822 Transcript_18933/m.47822 type:complete len:262 (-) Transcript_18933:169-954(-)|eukprot:jgi/Tetstr1/439093/TSEL_002960.t1
MLSALRYITGYGPSDAAGGTGGFGSTDLAGTSYTHGYSNGYDQVTVVDDEDDVLSAVKSGSMNALRFLLSDGADAKITDEVGRTALHVAVRKGRVDMISVLVGGGCEVNAKDKHGYTPLHLAAASGNAAIAWKLLELGAEVEATDCEGKTPMHVACCGSYDLDRLAKLLEVLRILISKKPDLDFRDDEGLAPIHIATMDGNIEAVQILLAAGANRALPDKHDRRPFDIATQRGFRRIINILTNEDNKAQVSKLKQYDKYLN